MKGIIIGGRNLKLFVENRPVSAYVCMAKWLHLEDLESRRYTLRCKKKREARNRTSLYLYYI